MFVFYCSTAYQKEIKVGVEKIRVNGNGHTPKIGTETENPSFVSLSQMISPPSKLHSKYAGLGIQVRSPEKNCRSFLRNINSFENIGRQNSGEGTTVTLVGEKMHHMLHLHPTPRLNKTETVPETANNSTDGVEKSEDVPDRVTQNVNAAVVDDRLV